MIVQNGGLTVDLSQIRLAIDLALHSASKHLSPPTHYTKAQRPLTSTYQAASKYHTIFLTSNMFRQSIVRAVRPATRSFTTTARIMAGGDTGAPRAGGGQG